MEINPLAIPALPSVGGASAPGATAATGIASFGQLLTAALGDLQHTQTRADTLVTAFATGQEVELHEVVLALEQANLATQLTVQVRNKLIEAYQEIARMQV